MSIIEQKSLAVPALLLQEPLQTPELRISEILTSPRRVWIRGRLASANPATNSRSARTGWWGKNLKQPPLEKLLLETKISRHVIQSEVVPTPEGYFEVYQEEALPPTRRGWRVARGKINIGEKVAEGCGVVLSLQEQATRGIIVLLPLSTTAPTEKLKDLVASEVGGRIKQILHQLTGKPTEPRPIYYLACAPLEAENRQQELSLTLAALGWPAGHLVLLPGTEVSGTEVLLQGLARLRWLFAGTLEFALINLEPRLTSLLSAPIADLEDKARVNLLINSDAAPPELLEELIRKGTGTPGVSLRPTRSYRLTRYPLVFCHGMLGLSALRMQLPDRVNYYSVLEPFLVERGLRVLFPDVAPTSQVAERAQQLKEQILHWTSEPVNLIAHSLGGLDCRYMIGHLEMSDRVRSLTTIATPHHGTYLADWFIQNYRHRFPLLVALELLGVNMGAFRDCRPAACERFNINTPDSPEVSYFSYGAEVPHWRVTPFLRRAWNILKPVEGPNDGIVSEQSAHWGEYLGTISADHFSQMPDAAGVTPGEAFDSLGFFLHVVEDLARRGF